MKCAFCGDSVKNLKKHYRNCSNIKELKEKYGEKQFIALYGKIMDEKNEQE